MRTIPCKPVIHNGVRFRSTQEARWAVFFESLGVEYHYEPSVEGLYYRPDFFVPYQKTFPYYCGTYFEVKPVPDDLEEEKCRMLSEKRKQRVGVLRGMPRPEDASFDTYCIHDVVYEEGGSDYMFAFCICEHCNALGFEYEGRSHRLHQTPYGHAYCDFKAMDDGGENSDHSTLLRAYMRALTHKW